MPTLLVRSMLVSGVLAWARVAAGQVSDEEDLAMVYGDKTFVSIATGARVPVNRAPAAASVITADDIVALGATDLDQVLETIPGLHVARGTQTNTPIYVIRGVHRDANPQVLMLVNGIPVTTIYQGNRGNGWGGLPLENVARIEVIRGPGSALYGADAFTGVINITTKTATDIDGTQFGARGGSFDSVDAWALHGGTVGAFDVAAYLRIGSTAGSKRTVAADAATPFGPGISHAPGPLNDGQDAIDGSLDLARDQWRMRIGYKERDHVGSGTGIASALDPTGRSYSERLTADISYRDQTFAKNWDVSAVASYMRYKEFSDLVLFPAGTNLGAGVFTDGVIGNPYKWERHGRVNATALYNGFEQHRVRLGTGVAYGAIYKIKETKNFNPDLSPIGGGTVADVTDVSNTVPFLTPHGRTVSYWFGQDEWSFARDWTLTAGLRSDRYSDFGQTTNPRLALAWEAAYNLTAKLLYGAAFRAPSFVELYSVNNPVQNGNPNLAPEKMKTTEAALFWQPAATLNLGVNIFHYQMRDIIQVVGTTFQNTGQQTGNGMEVEFSWDAGRDLRVSGNYSRQRSIDDATDRDAGMAPHDRVYLRADWLVQRGWAINGQINRVGTRQRAPADTRASLAGYTTVDLTLRTDHGVKGWNFAASVRNLFNADAREPSPFGTPYVAIPNDLPMPGRSIFVQASYSL